jgi:hypothetical protein
MHTSIHFFGEKAAQLVRQGHDAPISPAPETIRMLVGLAI